MVVEDEAGVEEKVLQEDEVEDSQPLARPSTRMSHASLTLPQSSVAGISGPDATQFEEYQDTRSRVQPQCHVWTATGDLIVGCTDGQLLKV